MQYFLPEFGYDIPTFIFLAFTLFAFIQLLFVTLFYSRVAFWKNKEEKQTKLKPVSVIIAARNESKNLYENLPFILEQDYPEFEVIIVNHQSVDDSKYILNAYKRQYPHLRTIEVERSEHLKYGKKLPLTIGIKGAKHEHLLFTDADCKPASDQWMRSMINQFNETKEIILGYGPYKRKKGLLNAIVRLDTAWIAMNYLSLAKGGIPYMGVGRNMAYTIDRFVAVNGFKSHYSLSSGDDDLFIQEAANRKNVEVTLDPNSYMYSAAPESWEELLRQKARHFTTAPHYKVIKRWVLGIYPLSLLIMTGTFVSLLFNSEFVWLSLAIYLFVLTIKWIIIGKALAKLKENKFVAWFPFVDLFYAIWAPTLYYSIDKSDNKKW